MSKKENKKGCHPRVLLSGISLIGYISKEKSLWINNKKAGDSRQRLSGMTTSFGFTLIELLVVVLIIGILAAVALPQYRKAVEKAKIAEAITLVRAAANAEKIYYMVNNTYTTNFNDLDIDFNINNDDNRAAIANNITVHLWRAITHETIYAQSKDLDTYRWVIYYTLADDKMYCGAQKEAAIPVCKAVGSGEELTCGPNNEVACWEIKY